MCKRLVQSGKGNDNRVKPRSRLAYGAEKRGECPSHGVYKRCVIWRILLSGIQTVLVGEDSIR
jgi:hypothetical protein